MQGKEKIKTAKLSILVPLVLTIIKLIVGILANSLSIISSSADSLLDLFSSIINFFSIKKAEQPPDKSHPYGHGKIENIASLFQVLLIIITAVTIIYKGILRLGSNVHIEHVDLGILVMILSSYVSFIFSRKLKRVSEEEESVALAAYSLNFKTDVYINFGIIASLAVYKFTGYIFFDSIMSIAIGLIIIWSTIDISLRSFDDLIDKELPPEISSKIKKIIEKHSEKILGYHKLRTRRAGAQKMIDLHLVGCKKLHLDEIHDIADLIEKEIEKEVSYSNVTIHTEPCMVEKCEAKEYLKEICEKQAKLPNINFTKLNQ